MALLLGLGQVTAAAAETEPPNVLGKTLAEATTLIQSGWYPGSGFVPTVSWTPDIPATLDSGSVIVLDVAEIHYADESDDANPSASVTYVVGTAVPNLAQLPEATALGIVTDLGFTLEAAGDEGGVVVGQSPEAGVQLPFGSAVQVTLAVAPSRTAFVPDLINLAEASASSEVRDIGLTFVVIERRGTEPFQVATQSPGVGTELALGEPVSVSLVGTALPRTVVVPDLTGQPPDQAEQTLTQLSLALRVDPDGDGRQGVAARQDPVAGTIVAQGTLVTVAFATPIVPPAPVDSGGFPWIWMVVLGGLVLLGVVAVLVVRLVRVRRPRFRVARPVSFEGRPDQHPVVRVRRAPDALDLSIALIPHADPGQTTVREPT